MALATSHLNLSHASQPFAVKSPLPPSPSKSTFMKLKTLIQTIIISHVCRLIRALSKAKSILIHSFKESWRKLIFFPKKASKKQKKIFFGSFRLHYNWCSSYVLPIPPLKSVEGLCYDSMWSSMYSMHPPIEDGLSRFINGYQDQAQLSGYLQRLEENDGDEFYSCSDDLEMNEIDRLADLFIASCHEQFRLEKVESYRMFQEMLARSL